MTRYAMAKQEQAQDDRLASFMSGQRAKRDRGEETGTAWRPPVDPLTRYIGTALGSPAEAVDRGDERMAAGWMRLTDRQREDFGSPVAMVKAAATNLLASYVDADPERDPVARFYLDQAKAAPRSAPPTTTPTMPVAEEAWIRARDEDRPYGASIADRAHELEAEIIAERAAAEGEDDEP